MLHSLVYHMVLVRQKCTNYPVAQRILLTSPTAAEKTSWAFREVAEPDRRRPRLFLAVSISQLDLPLRLFLFTSSPPFSELFFFYFLSKVAAVSLEDSKASREECCVDLKTSLLNLFTHSTTKAGTPLPPRNFNVICLSSPQQITAVLL